MSSGPNRRLVQNRCHAKMDTLPKKRFVQQIKPVWKWPRAKKKDPCERDDQLGLELTSGNWFSLELSEGSKC